MLEILRSGVEKADDLVKSTADAVKSHCRGCDASDDLTMLVVRYVNPSTSAGWERHVSLHDIDEMPRLHRFVQAVCEHARLDDALSMSVNLALEEAVSNVLLYAYPSGADPQADVDAVVLDDRIDFTVSDAGTPFDPTSVPDPDLTADLKDRPIGGLGIYLVRRIMDQVTYSRTGGKNILKMTKKR